MRKNKQTRELERDLYVAAVAIVILLLRRAHQALKDERTWDNIKSHRRRHQDWQEAEILQ